MGELMDHWIIAGSSAGILLLTLGGLVWKLRDWLAHEFTATRKSFHEVIDAHEALDQRRHEENLERFTQVKVALARAGLNGGSGAASSNLSDRHRR